MDAVEFERRMAVHQARFVDAQAKHEEFRRVSDPIWQAYTDLTSGGARIVRWKLTRPQRDELATAVGRSDFILGYPVVDRP